MIKDTVGCTPDDAANQVAVEANPLVIGIVGSFVDARGQAGRFTGSCRVERLLVLSEQLAASAWVSGRLVDAHGVTIGIGTRRLTAAVDATVSPHSFRLGFGPLTVNLLGFLVDLDEATIDLPLGEVPVQHVHAVVYGSAEGERLASARRADVDGHATTRTTHS
jgi:hypothetical protein